MNRQELTMWAFMDELEKVAKEQKPSTGRTLLKNVATGALGIGLGWGLSEAVRPLIAKALKGRVSPRNVALLSRIPAIAGMVGALAIRRVMDNAQKRITDVRQSSHN